MKKILGVLCALKGHDWTLVGNTWPLWTRYMECRRCGRVL